MCEHSRLVRKYAEFADAAQTASAWAESQGITTAIVRESYYDGARWSSGYNAMSWDAMLAERLDPSAIVAFRWSHMYADPADGVMRDRRQRRLFDLYEAQLVGDRRAISAALETAARA